MDNDGAIGIDSVDIIVQAQKGEIAFTSDRDGNYEIYVMNADGSNVTRLTNDPASDECPRWSRDGTRIAFLSNRTGNWQIWVMNADGSNARQVTDIPEGVNPDNCAGLSWYPNDQKISFIRRDYYLCSINIDGTNLVEIIPPDNPGLPYPHMLPAPNGCDISPDGTRFVVLKKFSDWGHDVELFIADINGNYLYQLTDTPLGDKQESQNAAWSPNGDKIAFEGIRYWISGEKNIFMINPDGSNLVNITDLPEVPWAAGMPRWSPEGDKIIFHGKAFTPDFEIYVINKDGTNLINLTNNPANDIHPDWRWQ